ncbi:hypothetical protein AA21291_1343 [Swaminathania salitolerans LMG 21291]|nr:hypothetical protein AA21291_1343 [Swaminathania salitolerans LMG 21291]
MRTAMRVLQFPCLCLSFLLMLIGIAHDAFGIPAGMFLYPDGRLAIGAIADTAQATELLGAYSNAFFLGVAALLYLAGENAHTHR